MRNAPALVICLVDIYDWSRGGHFRTYFRIYSRMLLEAGHKVIAICRKPEEITEWINQTVAAEHAVNFSAYPGHKPRRLRWLPKSISMPIAAWLRWRALAKDMRQTMTDEQAGIDGVFLMYLEDFVPQKGWLPLWLFERTFRRPWAFLSISSRFYREPKSPNEAARQTRRLFHPATANSCKGWCVLDEKIHGALRGLFPGASIHLLADVTDEAPPDVDFPLAQEVLERARGRKVVSLLGLLERRKGLLTLVRVAKQRPDIFFLFAGQYRDGAFNEEEKHELEKFLAMVPDNCLMQASRIDTEGQFNRLVCISDILFTAYLNFQGGSNVMTKAAVFRKPVIVSTGGLCYERLERYHLGVAIKEGSPEECSVAIDYLLSDAGRAEWRDYEGFARIMSLDILREQVVGLLSVFAGGS